jgi:hypothetical protein
MPPSVTTTILPNLDGVGGSCRKAYRYSATPTSCIDPEMPPKSTPDALLGETPRPHGLPNFGGL